MTSDLQKPFGAATDPATSDNSPARPLCFRVSDAERAALSRMAGGMTVSAYIRKQLFEGNASPRRQAPRRPSVDDVALAKALGSLGQSRLSQNLNQLAKAANTGALPMTDDMRRDLAQACEDVRAMRAALILALGLKDQSQSASTAPHADTLWSRPPR